jgi:AcrR family transcriptional regulator
MTSTPRPKRVRKTPEARRAEIVAKAAEISLAEGLEVVTLQRVASELGVRPGLIGHYFPVAHDLTAEAFGSAAEAELDALLPDDRAGHPGDADRADRPGQGATRRLARFLSLTSGEAYDTTSRIWLNARHLARYRPTLRARVEEQQSHWRGRLSALIADGVAAGEFRCADPEYAATAILVVLDGLGVHANTDAHTDRPPAIARMAAATAERELGLDPGTLTDTP